MPFKSEAQRRYLWMKHPKIARRWAKEYPNQSKLPKHVKHTGRKSKKLKNDMAKNYRHE